MHGPSCRQVGQTLRVRCTRLAMHTQRTHGSHSRKKNDTEHLEQPHFFWSHSIYPGKSESVQNEPAALSGPLLPPIIYSIQPHKRTKAQCKKREEKNKNPPPLVPHSTKTLLPSFPLSPSLFKPTPSPPRPRQPWHSRRRPPRSSPRP